MSVISPAVPNEESTSGFETSNVDLLCAGHVPAAPVEWLWPNRIPIGKVTLLVGDPGCGKSLVALDIAARVSRGAPWPDGNHNPQSEIQNPKSLISPSPTLPGSPSSVLILSAQDDLSDTIRPRLDAANADCNRVFILPAIADLRHDFAQLEAAIDRTPDCRLIIVDPINAYVGPNDAHFQTVVRKVLAPLARLAADRRIAILAIAHFRKTSGAAIYRAAGSMGLVSAARSVWALCRDHSHPSRHFFLPLKTNLTAAARGLAYSIEQISPGHPGIHWKSKPVDITPEVALAPPPKPRPEPVTERTAARKWLCETLADGPRPAREVQIEGKERGFLPRTLRRAFHELDGHTAKKGLHRGWWWSLNDQSSDEEERDTQKTADPFEGVTYEKDIANQRWHEDRGNYRPPEFKFPPPFEIPLVPNDDQKLMETILDNARRDQQRIDDFLQSVARERTSPPALESS